MMRIVIPRRSVLLLMAVVLVVMGALLALIYLPAAQIAIHPRLREHTAEQNIVLSQAVSAPDFVRYTLPARLVRHTASEERGVTREGAAVSDDFAKGEVKLINNLEEEQQLLPRTHLKYDASGIFFLTDSPVAIPPHSSVAMKVTAKEKGSAGNVAPGRFTIDKLPAEVKANVYAESVAAFTGGIAVETPLSEEEVAHAKTETLTRAQEKARAGLTAESGGAALTEALTTLQTREEFVSAQVGSRAQSFTIRAVVEAEAFLVDENDLLSLTLLSLRSLPSAEEEFVNFRPESFEISIAQADFERGEARVVGSLTGNFASKIGPTILDPGPLAGLTAEEVQARFKDIPAVGSVDVTLSPFWVRSVPGRKGSTQITIAN